MEIRITSLEDKQFDTKPIWERALAELLALRTDLETGMDSLRTDLRGEFKAGMDSFRTDLRGEFKAGMDSLRTDLRGEFKAGMDSLRTDLRGEFKAGIDSLRTDLRGEFKAGMDSLRTEMKAEFASVRHEMEHGSRRVARTIDTLNQNFLEMQTYQRYVDRRLDELETEIKPT